MENFIGISRDIRKHWIYQDNDYFKVWFEMLSCARYSKEPGRELVEGQLIDIQYGEFMYGRIKWSERLKVSERRLRTLIDKLIADEMIEVVSRHSKLTVYRIMNYSKYNHQSDQQKSQSYQHVEDTSDQHIDHQATSRRPPDDQQVTTKEDSKKANKDKKVNKDLNDPPQFVEFWDMYPRKVGNGDAMTAWKNAIKRGATADEIFRAVNNYKTTIQIAGTEAQFIKHPSSFLNKDRWKEYLAPLSVVNGGITSSTSRLQELYRKAEEAERLEANGGY